MKHAKPPPDQEDVPAQIDEMVEQERIVVPVVAEELEVERRQVITGVARISKRVHEREESISEVLVHEEVQVVHVPVGTMVESPPPVRSEGNTLIIPVLEEILVVEKRLLLKEEVHITTQRREEHTPQRVTLRSEEVVVERDHPQTAPADGGTDRARET